MQELKEQFDVDGLSKSPSIFDEAKMRWLNGEYLKAMTPQEFTAVAREWYDGSDIKGMFDYDKLSKLLIPRVEILSEIPEKINFLAHFSAFDTAMFEHKKMKITKTLALEVLQKIRPVLLEEEAWTDEELKAKLSECAQEWQVKSGQVFLPLRLAITAAAVTPGGATEIAELLGKEETIRRLDFSIKLLTEAL